MVLLAAAFAFPSIAAADLTEEGAVVLSPTPSHQGPWGYWSRERLEAAEPMPIVTLPEPEGSVEPEAPPETTSQATPSVTAEAASAAALASVFPTEPGSIEGVEISAAESNVFPNSANGKVFGTYEIPLPRKENEALKYERVDYVCSGTVVNSPHGNVIVTAGHCAIEPKSGTVTNSELIFVPGYRNKSKPFGSWRIKSIVVPELWLNTAKSGSRANEGTDVAFIELEKNSFQENVEQAVGSFGIDFDQRCQQTYTQYGYPAESPYNGELLYSHTAAYAGADTEGGFFPVPMKIASDFTRGASGGPWTVGVETGTPTVLSVTAYSYENQPGYLFGPYFGEGARKAYATVTKRALPARIEETCAPLPPIPGPPTPPTPSTPSTPSPQPTPEGVPAAKSVTLKVTRVRSVANGSAVLTAKVNVGGMLKLSGAAVRAESLDAPAAGKYRLVVAAKGATNRRLRQVGKAKVGVKIAFSTSGKTARLSKKIALSRSSVARAAQQHRSR